MKALIFALSTPSDRIHMAVADLADRMVVALVTFQAITDETAAIRCLMDRGFPWDAVALHAGEALETARVVNKGAA